MKRFADGRSGSIRGGDLAGFGGHDLQIRSRPAERLTAQSRPVTGVSDGLCTGVATETEVTVVASERNRNDDVAVDGHDSITER